MNTPLRLRKLIAKDLLQQQGDTICYVHDGEPQEIFRREGDKLMCHFFGEPFEYIPREDSLRRQQMFETSPRDNHSFIGLTNAYEKKVGGHTYAFFRNGDEMIEQAHFTKRHKSWFHKTKADYAETLLLTCKGMVAERVIGGFEGGGFGFDNGIIVPCPPLALHHYEMDLFIDALSQHLGPLDRPNYNALSTPYGTNCVRYQTRAFTHIGLPMKDMVKIQPFTWSPYHLAKRMEKHIQHPPEPFLKIRVKDHRAEARFLRGKVRNGQDVIYFETWDMKRANFPDATYNISPDVLLALADQKQFGFMQEFLQGKTMSPITVTTQEMQEYYERVINPLNHDHHKLPYILEHLGKMTPMRLPER